MKSLLERFAKADIPIMLKAAILTVFPLGSMHLLISHIVGLTTGNYNELNYFHILAIDLIFPELGQGVTNFWLSQLAWLIFFFWVWYLFRHKVKHRREAE